jgi:hypothetical protein
MYAYYAMEAGDGQIREAMETYLRHLPLGKVYEAKQQSTTSIGAAAPHGGGGS